MEAALKRALNTPHKPHAKPMSVRKVKKPTNAKR